MAEPAARPMRADAVRNRAAILDAARRQIAAHGADVGMDRIAVAAGVAVGTLYRHFPTKTDLVAAVVGAFMTQVADATEAAVARVADGGTAFDELTGLVREIVRAAATNDAVKAAATALGADVGEQPAIGRAAAALGSLVDTARRDGSVRADLSTEDFYLLVGNAPADRGSAALDRWVDLILFGIAGPGT